MSTKKAVILTVSALLGGIATNYPQSWWWLIIFSVAGLIFLLERSSVSYRKSFTVGAGYGIIYILTVLSYFWSAHPLDWAGVHNPWISLALVAFIWIASSVVLGVFFGFFAIFLKLLKTKFVWLNILSGATLWVGFEFLRSLAFSLFYYSENALVGPHWTFGFLGYTVAWSDALLPLVSIGGVYILGFVGFVFSYLLYLLIKSAAYRVRSKISLYPHSIIFGFIIAIFFIPAHIIIRSPVTGGEFLDVLLLSIYPTKDNQTTSKLISSQLLEAKNDNIKSDLVVMTEYADYLEKEGTAIPKEILSPGGVIIDSNIAYVDDTTKQAFVFFYEDGEKKVGEYHKRLLTPNGEYLPLFVKTTANLLGASGWVSFFDSTRGYKAGEKPSPVGVGSKDAGVLFCIEILSPSLYRELSLGGARFLVNTASHSNFKGSTLLINQNISMAKVRAVESGRYFAQSTNYGPAFVVTNQGTVEHITSVGSSQTLYVKIPLISSLTVYSLYGKYVPYVLVVIMLLVVAIKISSNIKRFPNNAID